MLYYKPQSLNPNKHTKMPDEYPWILSDIRTDEQDLEISQDDYDALIASISLTDYNNAIATEGTIAQFLASSDVSPLKVSVNNTVTNTAFANKVIETSSGTKKLYKRVTGIQPDLVVGENIINFTVPYDWVKITGIEIVNTEALEYSNMYVYDTAAGTYSGYPNAQLNQFGFNVNVTDHEYKWISEYDADIYRGMILRITYYSKSIKRLGINFSLNEVK